MFTLQVSTVSEVNTLSAEYRSHGYSVSVRKVDDVFTLTIKEGGKPATPPTIPSEGPVGVQKDSKTWVYTKKHLGYVQKKVLPILRERRIVHSFFLTEEGWVLKIK